MTTYKISLTPLGRYFFGGDMTFKVSGRKDNHNELFSSYIISSCYFPQQTSLLGMLRFLILSHDKQSFNQQTLRIQDPARAKNLIGASSFNINANYEINDFGRIKQLYPCFLEKVENDKSLPLLPTPNDWGYKIYFDKNEFVSINRQRIPLPLVEGYDPKVERNELYITPNGTIYSTEELFVKNPRIGINKNYSGITQADDSAFYKQIFYRLGNDKLEGKLHFSCLVEMDDQEELTRYSGTIVNIGGDDSKFRFDAIKVKETVVSPTYGKYYFDQDQQTGKTNYAYKVVLLSDAYLKPNPPRPLWSFAISDILPFRFLCTTLQTQHYSILSDGLKRSQKFYLYKKGSVFFCYDREELTALENALQAVPCFRQIGYNHYQTIPTNNV